MLVCKWQTLRSASSEGRSGWAEDLCLITAHLAESVGGVAQVQLEHLRAGGRLRQGDVHPLRAAHT